MIVYSSTKNGFSQDILDGVLVDKIEDAFFAHLGVILLKMRFDPGTILCSIWIEF